MNETSISFNESIYKKDSKGKIRILTVRIDGAELIQESGIMGGKLVVHQSTAKAKSVGRSNETTPEVQAWKQAKAKIEDKLTGEYFLTIEEAEEKGGAAVILPMLAKDYKKESNKIDWEGDVFVQPKLDGMRAAGEKDKRMISRKGKEITTMMHIETEIDEMMYEAIFDGELYAHGFNFQENMRLIKKHRGIPTEQVKYHVYDLFMPDKPFKERYRLLSAMIQNLDTIELVPTYRIRTEEQLKEVHQKFISEGYEGTMIRHGEGGYAINKRDTQLLKYKDFLDKVYKVHDIEPSDKNPKQGVVICIDDAGQTFGCGMKFSHAEREEILANKEKYIGQPGEIRFFEYSENGIPRFPVCHGFRLDK